jgi:hypothetical protein
MAADELNLAQQSTLPPELYQQQQALNRQQQMAAMLMQQNQQPQGQMVSGRYVPTSFFQNLQPVANMLTGAYLAKQGDTKAAELAQQLRAGRETEKQAAIPLIKKGDVASVLALPNEYGGVTPFLGAATKAAIPETPASVREFEYAKEHPELLPYLMAKANAGAARTSLNVQNQLPFKEQIQKEAASGLMKNFETLQNIPSTLQNMDKMVKLSQQPIYAGVGGETKLQIAKLLNNNFGTNLGQKEIGNTEEFKSAAYQGILENLKKTDSNPTMAQQNALKDAIGSLGTDPSALPRVVNVMRDVLINKAEQHNKLVQQTMQNGVQYPYSIEVPLPKAAPAGGGIGNVDTSSLDAILKSRGALK